MNVQDFRSNQIKNPRETGGLKLDEEALKKTRDANAQTKGSAYRLERFNTGQAVG